MTHNPMTEKFHALLRERGRSVTRARTLLFEYLQQSGAVSMTQFMSDNVAVAASFDATYTLHTTAARSNKDAEIHRPTRWPAARSAAPASGALWWCIVAQTQE